ncbi:MAG: purine-nucleoside phosphorylase [Gemmatimonadota bacterium]
MARVAEAEDAIRARSALIPRVGIILGTGLGRLADDIDVDAEISYDQLPHFVRPTLEGHAGRLILGSLEGTPVVAMQGRYHAYEGYTLQEVTFPVRVLRRLGAETLVVSGICGGMDPLRRPGDLVLLDDQLNLMGDNPLVGENLDDFGPRFPDMSEPYDRALQARALEAAMNRRIPLQRGVYAAVTGPSLETRAEYRMLRALGADVVGMSTVPEVIVANHMGMRVLGISIITDACLPDALQPVDVPTILRTAMEAEPKLATLIRDVVGSL